MTPVVEPIAVIGVGGRFPGAGDVEAFWRNVQAGADCLAEPVPEIGELDIGHFGLTPREAEELDPQVRIFLEVTAGAIEDAGYDVTMIGDGTAVFGSAAPSRYPAALPATTGMAALTSARLGLRGPSVTVGSGSLVSVHLACQSLRMGECDLAVAGGACLRLPGGTGSGAAVVVLKRLADAISDGDHIRAQIVGSATAQDELSAIAEAMAMADCEPQEISFTEVDDLAEAGSVASLIGYLGPAAGIAGLVRVVLSLDRERLGRAAVSFREPGGGHAYVVLEEGIPPAVPPPVRQPRVVVWSGRDEAANRAYGDRLSDFFAGLDEERFADAAATLQRGRTAHRVRSAVVCASAAEAAEMLGSGKDVLTGESRATGSPQVVLSFPGEEALHAGLATSLYGAVPVFTETMDICLELFEEAGLDLYDLWLHGAPEPASRQAKALLFAIEYSLACTWLRWCTAPSALTGDGLGGLVARTVGGELELSQAVRLIADDKESLGTHPTAPDLTDRVVLEVDPGSDLRHMLTTLAELWVRGCAVDWAAIDRDHVLQRLAVPGYPYQRSRHWAESAQPDTAGVSAGPVVEEVPGLPRSAEPLRPLGRLQHSFWMLEQLAAGSGVSNVFVAYRTARPLRWWPLQRAANQLLRRHPALRLRFPTAGGVPVRHLTAGPDAEISVDTVATTPETMTADLQSYAHTPFDIARDLPLRVGHFMIGGGDSALCLVVHHIVSDLASIEILVEELGRLYDAIAEHGAPPAELEAEVPMLAEAVPSPEAVAYWRERLAGLRPEAMALPGARPSPARPTFAGGTVSAHLSVDGVAAMRYLRQELRTTDNIVLLSAYLLTLLRHGAGPDLVVGVPVGSRRRAEAGQVGFGVRTLPVRVRADAEAGFRDLVLAAGGAFLGGAEHADVSVEVMLTEVGHHSGDWRVPVFRHMFNYRPWAEEKITICGEVPEPVPLGSDRSRLDLDLIAVPQQDGVWIRAAYSAEVHDEAEIAALVARMDLLLRQAAADPDRPIGRLDLCTDADRAVVDAANATGRDWEGGAGVLEQISARAAERPRTPAVIDGSEVIDYAELMGRAAALRDRLRTVGAGQGDVIALALGRGVGMAAAVLGVWAVGACYLPLDALHPGHRLRQLLDDADARLVVASGPVDWAGDREVVVPPGEPVPWGETTRLDLDTPAYVIYTSGSTGRPKGVIVTHRNLLNLVQDFTERLGVDASHAVLWSTTVAFDISALELFLPLCNGGRLVVADDQAQARPRSLLDLVTAHDVAVLQATPTMWRLAIGEVAGELGGRQVLCGGEPLTAALARRLIDRDCRLFNVYGPTETTIWSTAAELDRPPADPVTIGLPIANTQVFVLDPLGQELPPGLPGELCIAGSGVSAGYLRRPELTAERFGEHRRFGRFYRTGDLARFRPDGTLEMLGRTDRQVKLRGHRIELGEVESVLYEHGRVRAAAVIVSGDPQADGRLLAFVQTESPADPSELREELWEHARSRLPGAAVPSGIVFVDGFPTTPNNKIDYRALAKAAPADEPRPGSARPPVHGGDAGLSRLVELWQRILGRPRLGPDDNFFLSGGHSLLAIQLVTRIEETTGRALPVGAVFEHPTPARLAAHLNATAVSP